MTALTHKENDLHNRLIVAEFNLGQVEEELRRLREENEALRARLAQPEQEPVWVEVTTNTGDKFILDSAIEADKIRSAKNVGLSVVPLYTAPPQREWQGLTPEEVKEISLANRPYVVDMVVALEARLKEKNNAI